MREYDEDVDLARLVVNEETAAVLANGANNTAFHRPQHAQCVACMNSTHYAPAPCTRLRPCFSFNEGISKSWDLGVRRNAFFRALLGGCSVGTMKVT